jgi:serine/threonine-protein kinase HipA
VRSAVAVYVAAGARNALAGRLHGRHEAGEAASFSYDDDYLADPEAFALDPALPLAAGPMQPAAGRALFGAFADSTPDRWGRTLLHRAGRPAARAAGAAAVPAAETDVLLASRDDLRQGALRFRRGADGPFLAAGNPRVPVLADLPDLLDSAARVARDRARAEDLARLLTAGSSLGGARPKVHVRNAAGRVAIAKFPSPALDRWDVMAWEKVALDLARDAGLIVPESELIRVADQHVLIVERFDRRDGGRVGYASAKTMLQAGYDDRRSYLDIAAVIEEKSPAATADLRQLWRRIAFSVLITNTDDHLRNHGFLHDRREWWRLSPAFDVNPDPEAPKHLKTSIDHTGSRASVQALMTVADRFRLDAGAALGVLAEVTRAVAGWRKAAASLALPQHEIDLMAPAFEHPEGGRARALTASRPGGVR